eukprot:GHVQ01023635.1.p1 GENE.GHVQ01023635.1~~GHVQ01023635.1.p1  ORF type:complete len:108 (+),score=24.39 GHVQ01023635.1:367-690(+)
MQDTLTLPDEFTISESPGGAADKKTDSEMSESLMTVVHQTDDNLRIGVFDHIVVEIAADQDDNRHQFRLKFLRKSTVQDILPYEEALKERQRVDAEAFPDRVEPEAN